MTQLETLDLTRLVAEQDVVLCSLSDEQYQALWAAERLEVDPESEPVIAAAVRTLVAAGLAELTAEGDLLLVGDAALIRQARTGARRSIIWQHLSTPGQPLRTWSRLADEVLLEQRWEEPGVHRFVLRHLARAASDLATALVPAGSPETAAEVVAVPLDEAAEDRRTDSSQTTYVQLIVPVLDPADGTVLDLSQVELALVGTEETTHLLLPVEGGTSGSTVSRGSLRRHVRAWMGVEDGPAT